MFIFLLLFLIALVETFIEVYAIVTDKDRFDWKMVFAGMIGALFTFLLKIDLFAYFEVELVFDLPWLYTVLNMLIIGVLIMRYSGNLNDILEWVKALRPDKAPKKAPQGFSLEVHG